MAYNMAHGCTEKAMASHIHELRPAATIMCDNHTIGTGQQNSGGARTDGAITAMIAELPYENTNRVIPESQKRKRKRPEELTSRHDTASSNAGRSSGGTVSYSIEDNRKRSSTTRRKTTVVEEETESHSAAPTPQKCQASGIPKTASELQGASATVQLDPDDEPLSTKGLPSGRESVDDRIGRAQASTKRDSSIDRKRDAEVRALAALKLGPGSFSKEPAREFLKASECPRVASKSVPAVVLSSPSDSSDDESSTDEEYGRIKYGVKAWNKVKMFKKAREVAARIAPKMSTSAVVTAQAETSRTETAAVRHTSIPATETSSSSSGFKTIQKPQTSNAHLNSKDDGGPASSAIASNQSLAHRLMDTQSSDQAVKSGKGFKPHTSLPIKDKIINALKTQPYCNQNKPIDLTVESRVRQSLDPQSQLARAIHQAGERRKKISNEV